MNNSLTLGMLESVASKPNRLTDVKDKKYHAQYARWAVHNANNQRHIEHMRNINTNRSFYSPNKQWGFEEDVYGFLMDESGQTNNRIKVEMNYIQTLGNQYIGNANSMNITARCTSFSPLVKVRKEQKLAELLFWTDVAAQSEPKFGNFIKSNKPIGSSAQETAAIFENIYVDTYVNSMNSLLRYAETINRFNDRKKELAHSLVISGICIMKPEVYNNEFVFKWIQPDSFFFDRDAKEFDIRDASYMGEWSDMLPTEIYERYYDITDDDRQSIEGYTRSHLQYSLSGNDRIRVYNVTWRDVSVDEWGYIKNEFDDIVFKRINFKNEFEDKPQYTDADLVPLSALNDYQLSVVKKRRGTNAKPKLRTYTDEWRFCSFIPQEYLSSRTSINNPGDMVLDYGVVPFQEQNLYSPYNMEPPYKVGTYIYTDGFVYSPLDIAINPQRVANRLISVVENMMNNARGSGTVLMQEAVDKSTMTLDEINTRMKRNEPITMPGLAVGGVQNAVGKYDSNVSEGTYSFMNMANMFLQSIEKLTGVNEAMKGQSMGPDQLVGVTQLMIQRGSVVQQLFYEAIRSVYRACYQAVATTGKRFYINEKPKLVSIVGDDEAEVISLSKDMMMEDFRVTIKYSADPESERQYVDGLAMQFLQGGLITKQTFANVINRATTDEFWQAIRSDVKASAQAESEMAAIQQQEAASQGAMVAGAQQQAVDLENKKIDAKVVEAAMKSASK